MMYWHGDGMGGWGYVLMLVSNLLFWGLLVFGVVYAVRHLGRTPHQGGRSTPEQLLAERYARGDIDEDEYRKRLETLRAHSR